jgi:hypothetical protein
MKTDMIERPATISREIDDVAKMEVFRAIKVKIL